jgi:hypothetical protein
MSAPQVSWKAIEEDARVFSSEGEDVGQVTQVVGDATADVFSGLALRVQALGPRRFVAAERVRAIWPDRVDLDLSAEEIRSLPEHRDAPTARWRPQGGLLRRLLGR